MALEDILSSLGAALDDAPIIGNFIDPLDPEKEARYGAARDYRQQSGEMAMKRAIQERLRDEQILEAMGEEPMPEDSPGFLPQLLDTLDTSRQAVAGVIGKLAGASEFKDLGYLDAASRAMEKDTTTGELLREAPWFRKHDVARGVAGFIGDVATDPLSYITLGTGTARRIGGLAVTEDAIKLADGGEETASQILRRLQLAEEAKIPAAVSKLKAIGEGDTLKAIEDLEFAEAARRASRPFEDLRSALIQEKKARVSGIQQLDDVTGDPFNIETKFDEIQKQMGIANREELLKLVKRPALRLSGILSGSGESFGRLPLFGDREIEIPGITDLSAELYKTLDNAYYGAKVRTGSFFDDQIRKNPHSMLSGLGRKLSGFNEKTVSAASLLSRRVQSTKELFGSRARLEQMMEHERVREVLYVKTLAQANHAFGSFGVDVSEAGLKLREDVSNTLQSGVAHGLNKLGKIAEKPQDIVENVADYQKGLERLRTKYNAMEDGLGDRIAGLTEYIRADFKAMADKEAEMGILKSSIDGYVHQMYKAPQGMGYDGMRKVVDALVENPTLERVYGTMTDAKIAGHTPDEDIFNIYLTRKYFHERVLAEKDFASRMAYQWGLSSKAYKQLSQQLASESEGIKLRALRVARRLDTPLDLVEAKHDVFSHPDGTFLTLKNYDQIAAAKLNPESMSPVQVERALKEASEIKTPDGRPLDLTFPPEQRVKVEAMEQALRSNEMLLGREGEGAWTRAGGTTAKDLFPAHIVRAMKKEDKQFWDNVIPQGLAEAVMDAKDGATLLDDVVKRLEAKNVPNPLKHPLARAAKLYTGFHKIMKAGSTVIWPAYWARNLVGAQFQGGHSASALGQQLNFLRIWQSHEALHGAKGGLVTKDGVVYSQNQLRALLAQFGIGTKATSAADLIDTMADHLEATVGPDMFKRVRGLKQLVRDQEPSMIGKAELKARDYVNKMFMRKSKDVTPLTDRFWQKYMDLGSRLEAFGREHLFVNLLRDGWDPASAAQETNRLLIDYSHGKTAFEKRIMNNIFFFYSFSRGQATNNFISLMQRPGALTTQLHAHKGIAEMLTDPENMIESPDGEAAIQSARTDETLSTYLGINPVSGLPMRLSSTGLPVEDFQRFSGLRLPKRFKWQDVMQSVGDSTTRTLQLGMSQLNPGLKAVLSELTMKQNLYYNRPITDETIRKLPMWEKDIPILNNYKFNALPNKVWEMMDDATKAVLGGRDNGDGTMTINPYAMVVLNNFIPAASRFFNTRSALTKEGVNDMARMLRLFSGVQVQDIDAEKSIAMDRAKKSQEYLKVRGLPTSKRGLGLAQELEAMKGDAD